MPSCAFLKCSNNSRNTNKASGITFHTFPPDVEVKEKWIEVVRVSRRDGYWMWNKFSRICSAHFPDNEFYSTKKGLRKLKTTAVPELQVQEVEDCFYGGNPSFLCSVQQSDSWPNSPCNSEYISISSSVYESPVKADLKDRISKLVAKNKTHLLTIKALRQRNRRLEKKCTVLKSRLEDLENKHT